MASASARLSTAGEHLGHASQAALPRAAEPVLRTLFDSLHGQPVSVVLSDARGLLVYRLTGDHDLGRQLNLILLARGFAPAGRAVASAGSGTVLEPGGALFGPEQCAERLAVMTRDGVPVLDPVTGGTVGVVDLTGWRGQPDQLALPRSWPAAPYVQDAPAAASSDRALRLLQAYTQACRQRGGIVLGLGDNVVMLNDHARQALSPGDQAVLISCATEMLERRSAGAATVELPSGAVARMSCQPVAEPETSGTAPRVWPRRLGWVSRASRAGAREPGSPGHDAHGHDQQGHDQQGPGRGLAADGVVRVKLISPASTATAVPSPRPPMSLPGLVGSGAVWWRACRQAETAYLCGEWLALEGESGVGKLALIRAVHRRHHPAAPFHVLDAADGGDELLARARGELADGSGLLVLRRVHVLGTGHARALASALREAKAAGRDSLLRVALTFDGTAAGTSAAAAAELADIADIADTAGTDGTAATAGIAEATGTADTAGIADAAGTAGIADPDVPNGSGDLLRLFATVVDVPPLRHHSEDLGELVPFFLGRLGNQGQVTCSPAATQLLVRYAWPGNAAQLWQVLKQAVQRRRVGQIMPDDLPSEVWTVSRRVLSPLESIERDAIVRSLFDHGGSKIRAARALGMSRATIYRRIREYGIVT